MRTRVLIVHARGEEEQAEKLAVPIKNAGYSVVHGGTVLVGDSVIAEYSEVLAEGAPVVLCGTVRAMGTSWARRVTAAARFHPGVRLFVVQMEQDADVESVSFDESIARYWEDPGKASSDVVVALRKYFPPSSKPGAAQELQWMDLEARYRDLALRACDIIDLANLPEDDRHLATREIELRRLYVALRVRVESRGEQKADDDALKVVEMRRQKLWSDLRSQDTDDGHRVSLGERLKDARRLIVLGDPGAGKSTLLRWLATAYLLKSQKTADWVDIPDVASLPDEDLLPILVRCRDLPAQCCNLEEMLGHTLRKSEMAEADCRALWTLLRKRLTEGKALLLVDGLDELPTPAVRAQFAQQLEQAHRVYPNAPMVVTSRVVGYREMGYRVRSGFEHVSMLDLGATDKDDFARRWCALTEPADRREAALAELVRDIHSQDRIERLTGNPMLLTTMALIKRKIGKLPQRRADLYEKAVEVLLNWRSAVDAALDRREALPQLEYLAYAMCRDGVQQLREDQILILLGDVRREYPQIHALAQHTPEEFLGLLERRTGLVIESGYARHGGRSVPVYEFRHLTFQEYLAGIALVAGHFPGRNREEALEAAVAPLAVRESGSEVGKTELVIAQNWREALRLCVAVCSDDDVDAVLRAILRPLKGEQGSGRPRAVLAAFCLADEPNVSDEVAEEVLVAFVASLTDHDDEVVGSAAGPTPGNAIDELAASQWRARLSDCLLTEFFRRQDSSRSTVGSLASSVLAQTPEDHSADWFRAQAEILRTGSERNAAGAALAVMELAYGGVNCDQPGIVGGLLQRLSGGAAVAHAAAWALGWIHEHCAWQPKGAELNRLVAIVSNPDCDDEALFWLAKILGDSGAAKAARRLVQHLLSTSMRTRESVVKALGMLGDTFACRGLSLILVDPQETETIRKAAAHALGKIGGARAHKALLSIVRDREEDVSIRRAAMNAIGVMFRTTGDAGSIEELLQRLADKREPANIRVAAAAALGSDSEDRVLKTVPGRVERLRRAAVANTLAIPDDSVAIDRLRETLLDAVDDERVRVAAAHALIEFANSRAELALQEALACLNETVRKAVLGALARAQDDTVTRQLLSRDGDGMAPYLDPLVPIDHQRLTFVAERTGLHLAEVRQLYQTLAQRFGLVLAAQA
jgi:HEAT repeat protein